MKPSTENEIAGKVHEVKGKLKGKGGPNDQRSGLGADGLGEKIAGRFRRKSARWKKSLKSREPGRASHDRTATTTTF